MLSPHGEPIGTKIRSYLNLHENERCRRCGYKETRDPEQQKLIRELKRNQKRLIDRGSKTFDKKKSECWINTDLKAKQMNLESCCMIENVAQSRGLEYVYILSSAASVSKKDV